MAFRVYYGDGAVYAGAVENAPARNVQVIAQWPDENGWQAVSGTDYYVWRDGRWFGVDKFGLYDYLIEPGWKKVLFGRTLTTEQYNHIWQQMMADGKLPEKVGFSKRERRPKWVPQ